MRCPHCGGETPAEVFCGRCGGRLAETPSASWSKRHAAYAAAPHEHVLGLGLITTLFPHLPQHHAHAFRRVLAAGIAVVVGLAVFRLYGMATIAAALVLPILYMLYLYEVELYEHEPVRVLVATFVVGVVLGVGESLLVARRIGALYTTSSTATLVLLSAGAALLSQLLMVCGPLLLLGRRHFNEALDGLGFGVTSALGFSLATMLSGYWEIITGQLVGSQPALDWAVRLFRSGLLVFVVNAAATAVITTTIWLSRHRGGDRERRSTWESLAAGIAVAVVVQAGLGVASALVTDVLQLVAVWLLGALLLIVYLRLVVHHALIAEGGDFEEGEPTVCPECHRRVATMPFCPSCGVARSASPKAAHAIGEDLVVGTA